MLVGAKRKSRGSGNTGYWEVPGIGWKVKGERPKVKGIA